MPSSTPPLRFSCCLVSTSTSPSGVNKLLYGSFGVCFSPKGVVSLIVNPSQELEGNSSLRVSQTNPSGAYTPMRCLSRASGLAQMVDFLIEGISSSKMASIKSIMGTLNVNIVKYSKNGVQSAKNNGCSVEKMYSRRNNKNSSNAPSFL